jgi:hypothetical protein
VSRLSRIAVISEGGRLVGTQLLSGEQTNAKGPTARVVAGPGQTVVETEIEVPAQFTADETVEAFHQRVRTKTGLR